MTIKRNGNLVILKDGKVSCSCCEEQVCCMYRAARLADNSYTAADLPDQISFFGAILSKSGSQYGTTTNGIKLEDNVWAVYRNGSRSERRCLIGNGILDLFADSYTATINYINGVSVSHILTRLTVPKLDSFPPCVWYNEENNWSLWYWPPGCILGEPAPPGIACFDPAPLLDFKWVFDNNDATTIKLNGIQNTPVGNYETFYQEQISIIVS